MASLLPGSPQLPPAFPAQPSPWTGESLRDPIFLLSKIGSQATKLFSEVLEPLQIRPRHVAALRFIAAREGASQRELVEGLWSDSSSVVSLLDDFEARGLAERRRNAKDRRASAVYLTEEGHAVLEAALQLSKAVESAVLARLNEEQKAQLLDLLARVVTQHDDGPAEAPRSD